LVTLRPQYIPFAAAEQKPRTFSTEPTRRPGDGDALLNIGPILTI
jgi:hypothetical protein